MGKQEYEIIEYTDEGLRLNVRVDIPRKTVWLSKEQMASLFAATVP